MFKQIVLVSSLVLLAGCAGQVAGGEEVDPASDREIIVIDEVVVTPTEKACPDPKWIGHGGPSGLDWVWSCRKTRVV
jgi:PBP1b-binding outer membrane lipoprotein LpoB